MKSNWGCQGTNNIDREQRKKARNQTALKCETEQANYGEHIIYLKTQILNGLD